MSNKIRPRKRSRKEFLDVRTLLGMSRQDQADFAYADLRRYFRVRLWDGSHTCKWRKCKFPNKEIKTFEEATLDHIIPRSKGGHTRWVNVQLMHSKCNGEKSSEIVDYLPRWRYAKATSLAPSNRGKA